MLKLAVDKKNRKDYDNNHHRECVRDKPDDRTPTCFGKVVMLDRWSDTTPQHPPETMGAFVLSKEILLWEDNPMQIENIKTIPELSQLDGRVYVRLPTDEIANHFMRQADAEGFTFGDGVKPTNRCATEVMAVNPYQTINYVGAAGHMAFGAGGQDSRRTAFAKIHLYG